ncbi:MAG: hypothetical protein J5533_08850, partial [Bacteroidales bacterium]|nr:hypothetical protein [Bacteroidales bacterium]
LVSIVLLAAAIWARGQVDDYVLDLTDSKMVLRHEDYPLGGVFNPSFKDKSGKHCFYVFEYRCLEGA